jgi:hypothetical protein
VPGFDAEQGALNTHALSKVNLISKVVITDQQQRFDEARRDDPIGARACSVARRDR